MRKNLFELIIGNKKTLLKEYIRLKKLLYKKSDITHISLLDYFNKNFINWNYRERYVNLSELTFDLGIDTISMFLNISTYKLLLFCELFYNLHFVVLNNSFCDEHLMAHFIDNIVSLVHDLNYDFRKMNNGQYIIIENSPLTTSIAEQRPSLTNLVIEYRRFSMKGMLDEKRVILKQLADEIEPLRKNFKSSAYIDIIDDTFFLLNNLNIRHNNLVGINKKQYVVNMSSKELEKWYDIVYDMILGVFTLQNYLNTKEEIKKLKNGLN